MRRISTFALFETEQYDRWDIASSLDPLNAKVKELGMHFLPSRGALLSYNNVLRNGSTTPRDVITSTRKHEECKFRSLILPVFFGVTREYESSCGLRFFDASRAELLNWMGIRLVSHTSYIEEHNIGVPAPPEGSTQASGDAFNVRNMVGSIKTMLGNITVIKCSKNSRIQEEPLAFPEVVSPLLVAFASYAMGEPGGVGEIRDAIRDSGAVQGALISRIEKMAPHLWADLEPALGSGASETSVLGDLGF